MPDDDHHDGRQTAPSGSEVAQTRNDTATEKATEPTTDMAQPLELDDFGLPVKHRVDVVEPVTASLEDTGDRQSSEEKSRSTGTPEPEIGEAQANVIDLSTHQSPKSQRPPSGLPSEWSHQQLGPKPNGHKDATENEADEWQSMPAYAPFDMYNDDGKLVAREVAESDDEVVQYGNLGGAGKGYTRVQMDEDAQSATSMDDNTAYLFKEQGTNVQDEDDEARDAITQMQATKDLLTEGQRVAYVGLVRLAMIEMQTNVDRLEKTKGAKKIIELASESLKMWGQQMMVRLYAHMEIDTAEQVMIEQLAEHGVEPGDLSPTLKQNARVQNPRRSSTSSKRNSVPSPRQSVSMNEPVPTQEEASPDTAGAAQGSITSLSRSYPAVSESDHSSKTDVTAELPKYEENASTELHEVKTISQLPQTRNLDIDIRWTILCDLFLVLISDSLYDCRSRKLLETVGEYLDIAWLEICRFEKRVTDALEMQEAADKENWNEDEHMANREKLARKRRFMMMGLATVGGSLVIGLSAGLLAPVIGAGLAAGFTTIGVAGTTGFLAGAGGTAIIATTGVVTGGTIAVRASSRRTGAVKTFEYRPLHNNKRVNLIVTVSGWMTGKVDDVRLPFSTVDPIMGDIYSVFWEPDMLRSMGDTINILATEALTQGLQQILGSTILIALMAALQLPIVLTKLAYLIDNPWSVSVTRADAAGLILADSLIDRNLGSRPVTLVGFSLGSRVIYACLRELAKQGQFGLIQNVYMFGTPVVATKDEYLKARTVVSGRFVNGYATNDWILGYLFRATGGGVARVAGLAPVEVTGIENINVTEWVPGHMSYRKSMPRLLREVGWDVESDEFTEIEDPDPENHEQRQRELINEIEEARKQLQQKPEKKRFGFWSRRKAAEKKEWEMYDEKTIQEQLRKDAAGGTVEGPVLFDIDAIMKEVAHLSAEGIEVKQLETTLPPMKLTLSPKAQDTKPAELRQTRSFDDSLASPSKMESNSATLPPAKSTAGTPSKSHKVRPSDDEDEGEISMTFESAYESPSHIKRVVSVNEPKPDVYHTPPSTRTVEDSRDVSAAPIMPEANERPRLRTSTTMPTTVTMASLEHNAWMDDADEFRPSGNEEVQMTFE